MKAAIRAELDRLKEKAPNGLLTRKAVIIAARKKTSPLHSFFTWDQQRGFEKNLEAEAGELLRAYTIVLVPPSGGDPVRFRHFVSLTTDRVNGGGYRTIEETINHAGTRRQLLADALADLESITTRYRKIEQLTNVIKEIDRVLETHGKKKRGEARAAA